MSSAEASPAECRTGARMRRAGGNVRACRSSAFLQAPGGPPTDSRSRRQPRARRLGPCPTSTPRHAGHQQPWRIGYGRDVSSTAGRVGTGCRRCDTGAFAAAWPPPAPRCQRRGVRRRSRISPRESLLAGTPGLRRERPAACCPQVNLSPGNRQRLYGRCSRPFRAAIGDPPPGRTRLTLTGRRGQRPDRRGPRPRWQGAGWRSRGTRSGPGSAGRWSVLVSLARSNARNWGRPVRWIP